MAEELQLDQAVRLALKYNVDVANSALDVSIAKDRSAAFRTYLFPKLSFTRWAPSCYSPSISQWGKELWSRIPRLDRSRRGTSYAVRRRFPPASWSGA